MNMKYEIPLAKYQKNLAFYKNKMAICQRKVDEFQLFSYTFHSTLVIHENKCLQKAMI